mmetsp:Transcript_12688/g.32613  ORF Transcript_12688/g.32613 Transcript_12688/m.32613 type:complete len:237 (-) Transcript_12688:25-735(-)
MAGLVVLVTGRLVQHHPLHHPRGLHIAERGRGWRVRDTGDGTCDDHDGNGAGRDDRRPGEVADVMFRVVAVPVDLARRDAVDDPEHDVDHHKVPHHDHVPRRPQPPRAEQRQGAAEREEGAAQDHHHPDPVDPHGPWVVRPVHGQALRCPAGLGLRCVPEQEVQGPEQRGDDHCQHNVHDQRDAGTPLAASCVRGMELLRLGGMLHSLRAHLGSESTGVHGSDAVGLIGTSKANVA